MYTYGRSRSGRIAGFTLIELMITVAILAILAAIAYPSYKSQIFKSRRADGKVALTETMQVEERYYTENFTYTTDLSGDIGLAGNSPEGWYNVTAAACGGGIAQCVQLTATAQGDQTNDAQCGNLTLNSLGARGITGSGSVADCW